ncbi:DUF2865 domain-containing protein [Pseudorhodoplanes sp.]|uniref:DUF2865 domain-containing protein n=1 Tax=Pseudorhodoplanes sp. TaxID=1934341 RepID=UPI003D0D4E43
MLRICRSPKNRRVAFALVAGCVIAAGYPSFAQAFFDLFFRHARPAPPQVRSYADPSHDNRDPVSRRGGNREGRGGSVAYCVRLCDGRYFPINYRGGGPELCSSLCPASPTQVFSGDSIDRARSDDGKRYSEIPNAYLYREKLVPGCGCAAGKPLGLARQDIEDDPTLRKGDILATKNGFMSYRGHTRRYADFEPLNINKLPKAQRRRLSETGIQPAPVSHAPAETTGMAPASSGVDRRAQASR